MELLVVISIIGILSAIIFVNFEDARANARNQALMSELKEVQLALEVYKSQNSRYPADIDTLSPDFIGAIPVDSDSKNTNCNINYQVEASGSWYKLTAIRCFEGADNASEGIQPDTEFSRYPSSCSYSASDPSFYESMAVYSDGGECQ